MKIHHAQYKRYRNNLVRLFNTATPEMYDKGAGWYLEAHNICAKFSEQYGVPLITVCQVMAILSPATSWPNNVKSCENMLEAFQLGAETTQEFKVTTYNANKVLAWEVLNGRKHFLLTRSNMKTYSFFWNMYIPYCAERVTIDRHAIKAMEGIKHAGKALVSAPLYRKAQHVYKTVAKELNLTPNKLQAIVWLAYKQEVGR